MGKRELIFLCCRLLVTMRFLLGGVSSSWCLGWAALFYCGTPCAFHIISFQFIAVDHLYRLQQQIDNTTGNIDVVRGL